MAEVFGPVQDSTSAHKRDTARRWANYVNGDEKVGTSVRDDRTLYS
jgi:hypothetical protein